MTSDEGPRLTYLGTFTEGVPRVAVIPKEVLRAADERIAAERLKRKLDAEKQALRVMQNARANTRLRKALRMLGFKGRIR